MRRAQTSAALASLLVCASLVAGGCGGSGDGGTTSTAHRNPSHTTSHTPPKVALHHVATFDQPVLATPVPGTDLIAVVEQRGRVRLAQGMTCSARDKCPARPVTRGRVIVDLSSKVSHGAEQGLLGLAFHPKWPDDPRIFLNYTDRAGTTHVEAWTLPTPAARANKRQELLQIPQPFPNHNGGNLVFGPDGLLYIGMGDGGSAGDPGDRAQSPDELLGKMLRIDVDAGGTRGYAPADGNLAGGAPEVWALGLRNPWRFSFDRKTGDLWIGDVGQDAHEEIDAIERGAITGSTPPNFQWRLREGFSAFDDSGADGPGRSTPPVLDYGRDHGCSVTGGYVYRGTSIPELDGWYVFADYCGNDLRMARSDGVPGSTQARGSLRWTSRPGVAQVASFGETSRGELLVVSHDGRIWQIVSTP